jgi:TRAP-type uncharacterized transport system fused permease subunit
MTTQTRYDDWIVYAAFVPALLTLVGIGVTVAIAAHNQALWNAATLSAVRADADDYVQGLAKRGIITLPGYEPPPAVDLVSHHQ